MSSSMGSLVSAFKPQAEYKFCTAAILQVYFTKITSTEVYNHALFQYPKVDDSVRSHFRVSTSMLFITDLGISNTGYLAGTYSKTFTPKFEIIGQEV